MGNQFNAPATRSPVSGQLPTWDAKLNQWVAKTAPLGQNQVFTSTGAFGPYTITFAKAYKVAPTVVASSGLAAGNITIINVTSVTTTAFQFSVAMFTPGLVVIPNATTFLLEWIAVGN